MSVNIADPDILKLYNKIDDEQNYTSKKIHNYMNQIYDLKTKYINDDHHFKILTHMENYLKYEKDRLTSYKIHLLNLLNAIFLPLGFVVGFFGMNFRSMGNPAKNFGILSIKNASWLILGIAIIISIIMLNLFYYYLDEY